MKARELVKRLLVQGFFPDHLTPPFASDDLARAYPAILDYLRPLRPTRRRKLGLYPRAGAVRHSVPKRRLSRRYLSIPNPLHHVLVSRVISKNWGAIDRFCAQSTISLSSPILGGARAIEPATPKRLETRERALRSIGKRFLLRADLARFYPSIYTHSIPWALHGKQNARDNTDLYGNRIDERIRESQDKQTVGIPIGPDTSFLIAEAVATSLDIAMEKRIGRLHGTRFIDDYNLYFDSYNDAEAALAALHEAAASLELEINDLKTEIVLTPEALEPDWKSDLRSKIADASATDQHSQILDLFSRASTLALLYPHDNVLTFVAKMIEAFDVADRHWPLCEALLLRSAVAEPKILRTLLEIYEQGRFAPDLIKIKQVIDTICIEHGRLQHGNEVLWALWTARTLNIHLGPDVAAVVSNVDDDLVALTALHLEIEEGIANLDKTLWRRSMSKSGLYSSHWLLAYEASVKEWLTPPRGGDFTLADEFFRLLRAHDVSFYDIAAEESDTDSEYTDESGEFSGLEESRDRGHYEPAAEDAGS